MMDYILRPFLVLSQRSLRRFTFIFSLVTSSARKSIIGAYAHPFIQFLAIICLRGQKVIHFPNT